MSRKIADKTDKLQVQNLTDINPEGTVRTPHKQDEEDTLSAQQDAQNPGERSVGRPGTSQKV